MELVKCDLTGRISSKRAVDGFSKGGLKKMSMASINFGAVRVMFLLLLYCFRATHNVYAAE